MKEKDQRILGSVGLGLAAGVSVYVTRTLKSDKAEYSPNAIKSLVVGIVTGVSTYILSGNKEAEPVVVVDKQVEVKVVETEKCVCKCDKHLEPQAGIPPAIAEPTFSLNQAGSQSRADDSAQAENAGDVNKDKATSQGATGPKTMEGGAENHKAADGQDLAASDQHNTQSTGAAAKEEEAEREADDHNRAGERGEESFV